MIVNLDGRELDVTPAEGTTLQVLIDDVRDKHLSGRLVVSVAVNGQTLADADLDRLLAAPLEVDARIELESGDRRELGAAALREVAEQVAEAGPEQVRIAEQLNAGQVAEGVQQVGACLNVWNLCRQTVLQCCGLLGEDLTTHQYEGRELSAYLDELVEKLRELRDAFESRDMVLLADVLHYEMPPLCESWSALLSHLADHVAEPADVAG
jgi:hypothetical protein